jgi:hypothetical protein
LESALQVVLASQTTVISLLPEQLMATDAFTQWGWHGATQLPLTQMLPPVHPPFESSMVEPVQTAAAVGDEQTVLPAWHAVGRQSTLAMQGATHAPFLQTLPFAQVAWVSSAPESRHSAWLMGLAQIVFPARQAAIPCVQTTPAAQAVTQLPPAQTIPPPQAWLS